MSKSFVFKVHPHMLKLHNFLIPIVFHALNKHDYIESYPRSLVHKN